jgi:hypothetical protein
MSKIRLSETRDLFTSELTFPATCEDVIDTCGDVTLQAPGGESESIGDALDRCESTEFTSADELVATLLTFVSQDYVGRTGYDDRGNNPSYDDEVSL